MTKLIFDVDSVASEMGLSKRSIYKLIRNNTVAASKIMGRWFILKQSIEAMLHNNKFNKIERKNENE